MTQNVVKRSSGRRYDREIFGLALPALGALAAEPTYLLVDTAIVGHLGTPQLAALAIAATLLGTAVTLFNFLTYGTTARVARLHGAGELAAAGRIGSQALWLSLALGGMLLALIVLLAAPAAAEPPGARPHKQPGSGVAGDGHVEDQAGPGLNPAEFHYPVFSFQLAPKCGLSSFDPARNDGVVRAGRELGPCGDGGQDLALRARGPASPPHAARKVRAVQTSAPRRPRPDGPEPAQVRRYG